MEMMLKPMATEAMIGDQIDIEGCSSQQTLAKCQRLAVGARGRQRAEEKELT